VARFIPPFAIAGQIPDLPEGRAAAFEDPTASALKPQRAQLSEVAVKGPRVATGSKVKIGGPAFDNSGFSAV
jgi:hypothetical protein